MRHKQHTLLNKLDYPVPKHANSVLYMFGGISLAAFVILIISGIYLTQVYSPTPTASHASLIYAITKVPLADFARSVHFWAANLVVVLLIFHVIRVFITGSYKKPRQLTWLTGVALLGLTIIYIFVGTVLKWDQESAEAFGHLQESFKLFGLRISQTNEGVPVITQLYSWHTTILLLILLMLLAFHMVLIKFNGISAKPTKQAVSAATSGTGSSSFLSHLRRLSGFGLLFFALASMLSIISPAPIGYSGILEQEVTKPLWMFWPFFGLEDLFGLKGLVGGMGIFFALLAAVPFLDRSPYLHWSKRKLTLSIGALVFVALIGLAAYSRLRPPAVHLVDSASMAMSQKATADNHVISHAKLRSEAVYLVPMTAAVGAAGYWLAYKKTRE